LSAALSPAAPSFTVLLPVHRGPDLLPFAIESVLAQQRDDFELFVICDGAPPATGQCARGFAAIDPRVQVFDLPKGERNGELHREVALSTARGTYVCQIADDDLWFPDHLDEMTQLLETCDFGNLTQTDVLPDGRLASHICDLSHPPTIQRMLRERFNFFGPTVCGYRLDAYRRLAERWAPAPSDIWSDLYMWRKFLSAPAMKVATRHVITSLSFPTPDRRGWTIADRRAEIERYADEARTAAGRSRIRADALRHTATHLADEQSELLALRRKRYLHRAVGKARRVLRRLFDTGD
jgi:glycosyltransferase involved in cell wall biosynthesis